MDYERFFKELYDEIPINSTTNDSSSIIIQTLTYIKTGILPSDPMGHGGETY